MASDENPERASQSGGTTKVLHYKQLEDWKKGMALVKELVFELQRMLAAMRSKLRAAGLPLATELLDA